jgi:hypothetical protein
VIFEPFLQLEHALQNISYITRGLSNSQPYRRARLV